MWAYLPPPLLLLSPVPPPVQSMLLGSHFPPASTLSSTACPLSALSCRGWKPALVTLAFLIILPKTHFPFLDFPTQMISALFPCSHPRAWRYQGLPLPQSCLLSLQTHVLPMSLTSFSPLHSFSFFVVSTSFFLLCHPPPSPISMTL